MSGLPLLITSSSAAAVPTYVDDVFSAYTYTGTGASLPIVNGIDLAGKGGMVWLKSRSAANPAFIMDTVRGVSSTLQPSTTGAAGAIATAVTAFNSNGMTLGTNTNTNTASTNNVAWAFRKEPKFLDIVTYTGDGTASKTVNHSLGTTVGTIIVKRTNSTGSWYVYHIALGAGKYILLNSTAASVSSSSMWAATEPTASSFTVGDIGGTNVSGANYIAYVIAHNPASDGLVQCGSWVSTGSPQQVSLGKEPQFLLAKNTTTVDGWQMLDTSRGWVATSSASVQLSANSSAAEVTTNKGAPNATGFTASGFGENSGDTMIYIAIPRNNKPPTSGAQVYNALPKRVGTSGAVDLSGVGFSPDLMLSADTNAGLAYGTYWIDKLRGGTKYIGSSNTSVEGAEANQVTQWGVDGVTLGSDATGTVNNNTVTYMLWFLKRAVGVFDILSFTGDASSPQTVQHNFGVKPQLMIAKCRNIAGYGWAVYVEALGAGNKLSLHRSDASGASSAWGATEPTSTTFTVGSGEDAKPSAGAAMIVYMFATKAGISKVGSYTGNGTTLNVDCGFAAGARFVLIKRTDAAGDWYVWDTVRGIVAANDPHLSINTTAAEVTTDDSIDPFAAGFTVNQVAATNINVNAATYIFLAFA